MLNTTYNDYLNLAKYATMTAINEEAVSPFSGAGIMAGIEGGLWAFRNGKNLFHWSTLKQALVPTKAQVATYKNIWKNSGNIFKAASNQRAYAKLSQMGSADAGVQAAINNATAKAASATPGNLAAEVENIEKMQKAAAKANPGKFVKYVKGTKVGKLYSNAKNAVKSGVKAFKNSLGIGSKAASATTSATVGTTGKVISKCGKFVKGNALFLAISAAAETFTNIVPTFKQLGKKAGWRQIGKSTAKVAGSVGGWAAGAAIGSLICPGAGTLVGALVGLGCSILGSYAGEKLASAIVGKDELEIAKEQQSEQIANAAIEDPEVRQELVEVVQDRLNEEGLTKDGVVAQDSLRRVVRDNTKPVDRNAQTPDTEEATDSTKASTTSASYGTTSATNKQTAANNQRFAALTALAGGAYNGNSNGYAQVNPYGGFGFNNMMAFNPYNSFNFGYFSNPFAFNNFSMGSYNTNPFMFNSFNVGAYNPYILNPYASQTYNNPYLMNPKYLGYVA